MSNWYSEFVINDKNIFNQPKRTTEHLSLSALNLSFGVQPIHRQLWVAMLIYT